MKLRNRFRVAVALALTLAMVVSLWFASPVKALEITISDPSDPSPQTLGTDIPFEMEVSIGAYEFYVIKNVDLEIYNVANPDTYYDKYVGLPIDTTEDYANYSTQGTGGNARIKATAETGMRGFGYAFFTMTTAITYDVIWDSPDDWPGGEYEIKVTTEADSTTYTETRTVTLLAPVIVDTTPPIISGISADNITKTSADISWITNEPADSRVEYDGKLSSLDRTLTLKHIIHLTDLTLATTYHIRVISKDEAGNQTVSAEYTFTTLGVPATFTVSELSISPTEVDTGKKVSISVFITNTGDLEGTYEVTLKINNVVVDSEEITLAGGASQKVTFTAARDKAGTYPVNVNGQTGTFAVREVPVEPPVVPPSPTNWWLIGGIIAACVIIGLVIWQLVIRRRALV